MAHRIDTAGAAPGGFFSDGNFAGGVRPTVPDEDYMNDMQEQVTRAIERTGNTLVKNDYDQMADFVIGNSHPVFLSNFVSLQAALAYIGATTRVLAIDIDQAFSGTATVPGNVTLWAPGTGRLIMATGAVLTIRGPVVFPKKQIFVYQAYSLDPNGRVYFQAYARREVYPEWFGADPGSFAAGAGGIADAQAINLALQSLTPEGGTVRLSEGIYSLHPAYWAYPHLIRVPSRVNLVGAGMTATVLKKWQALRSDNGNLIANEGVDIGTGTGGAAGFFRLADFTIDAGALSPNATQGDLIGLGHGTGIIVERVLFGNHDQSGLRIHGCQEITVRDCRFTNQVALAVAVPLRIEKSFNVGNNSDFLGANIDGTDSQEITVENNHFVNFRADCGIELRSGNSLYRTRIHDNTISANDQLSNGACAIYMTAITNAWMLSIRRNHINMYRGANHVNGIVIDSITASQQRGVTIAQNMIQGGNMRLGIKVGGDRTPSASFVGVKRLIIAENTIEMDNSIFEATDYCGIKVYGSTGLIDGNSIKPPMQYSATPLPTGHNGIVVDSCEDITVSNNRIEHDNAVSQPYQNYYGIKVKIDNSAAQSLLSRVRVVANRVHGDYRVFIGLDDTLLTVLANVNISAVFSENRTRGVAYRAHYLDMCGACDGTNDRQLYDFSPYGGTRSYYALSANNSYPTSTYILGLGFAMHRKVTYIGLIDGAQPRMWFRMRFATAVALGGQTVWYDMSQTTDGGAKLWGTYVYQLRCTDNGSGNVPATCEFWLNTGKDGTCIWPNSFANHAPTYGGAGYIMLEVGI